MFKYLFLVSQLIVPGMHCMEGESSSQEVSLVVRKIEITQKTFMLTEPGIYRFMKNDCVKTQVIVSAGQVTKIVFDPQGKWNGTELQSSQEKTQKLLDGARKRAYEASKI